MTGTPKVVFWTEAPAPATVRRLNAVAATGDVEIEAWFSRPAYDDRSWVVSTEQARFIWRNLQCESLLGRLPLRELADGRPDLIVQGYDRWFFAAGFLAARAVAQRTAFRVLPNYDLVSQRTWWREVSKHFLFRSVDAAKVPGPEGAAMAERYGLPSRCSFRVTQSTDISWFETARVIEPTVRERDRVSCGLEGCTFLYVGRLLHVKGVDYLFDAFEKLQALNPRTSLLVVGEGADQERYERRAAKIPRVRLVGFVHEHELPRYYAMADVFVFPTLGDAYGLVVDEALAAGLPIVSTASAGDIRARLEGRGVGRVVPPADADALAQAMAGLARDEHLRLAMHERTWDAVAKNTDERYAEDFVRFVFATLANPRRSGLAAGVATAAGRALLTAASLGERFDPQAPRSAATLRRTPRTVGEVFRRNRAHPSGR